MEDSRARDPENGENPPKRKPKKEETSDDDESDDEVPSSDLSNDEDVAEATEEFATIIPGPPTVTDVEDAAGKNLVYDYHSYIYSVLQRKPTMIYQRSGSAQTNHPPQ